MLKEWQAIFKKPVTFIIIIGVALIPMLYNIIFLSSMWDPYGKVDHLPVAVVNEDKATKLNDKTIEIGQSMVEAMTKNKNLDYHFVNQQEAEKGLEKGDYYMIITLPKDLSHQAASFLTDKPKQMKISYQTSAGRSFIASKMSDSAMNTLKANVTENVSVTYTTAMLQAFSKLDTGLNSATDGGSKLVNGSKQLQTGSQTLTDNLNKLSSSSLTFADGSQTLEVGLAQYTQGVTQLTQGSAQLTQGLTSYTAGVSQVAQGANQLNQNSQTLQNGIDQLASAQDGITQLAQGANQLNQGLSTLASKSELSAEQQAQITTLIQGLPELNQAIQSLVSTSASNTEAITTYLQSIATQAQTILENSQNDQKVVTSAVQATAAYNSLDDTSKAEINQALAQGGTQTQAAAKSILSQVEQMSTALSTLTNPETSTKLNQLATTANQALPGAAQALDSLSGGMAQISTALNQQILPGSTALASNLDTLNQEFSKVSQLQTGISDYTTGVEKIAQGTNQLVSNNEQLLSGAQKLTDGSNLLDSKSSQLLSGSNKLTQGANQMASGAGQLASGGNQLGQGLNQLATGSQSLTDGLTSASKQLSSINTSDKNAQALASPVAIKHTDNDNVPVNGIAMAPYMMSVALMVVALSTNMIFEQSPSGIEIKTRKQWLASKAAVNGLIAVLSSLILYFAIHLLPFTANYGMKTLGLLILASLVFMALVTALSTWHKKVGAFFALILLLLQLGSSAGTYPLPLTDKFFQAINPWLPMSYTVSGLRETISMTGHITQQVTMLIIFLIVFTLFGIAGFRKNQR